MNENQNKSLSDFFIEENGTLVLQLEDPAVQEYLRIEGIEEYTDEDLLGLIFHSTEPETIESNLGETDNLVTRYFGDSRICYSCGDSGHIESRCPTRNFLLCIMCAGNDHEKYNCPQMVCSRCNMYGHRFQDCQEVIDRRRFIICNKCPYEHPISECPLSWRIYRGINKRPGRITDMCCCICLSTDHFTDDCGENRTKNSIFTSKYEFFLRNRRFK